MFKTIYGVQKEHGWWYAIVKKTFLGVCYSKEYISDCCKVTFSSETKDASYCGFHNEVTAKVVIPMYQEYQEQKVKREQDNTSFKEVS